MITEKDQYPVNIGLLPKIVPERQAVGVGIGTEFDCPSALADFPKAPDSLSVTAGSLDALRLKNLQATDFSTIMPGSLSV